MAAAAAAAAMFLLFFCLLCNRAGRKAVMKGGLDVGGNKGLKSRLEKDLCM